MRRFRFHLSSLVFVVLVIGVSLAALRESNEAWDSCIFTLTLVILLTSVLLAVHRTEKRRAYWLGFALFGAAYLGLSLVPPVESRLITSKALAFIDSKVPRSIPAGFAYFDYDNDGKMDLYVVNNSQPNALYLDKGNGTFQDVTATVGSNPGNQATGSGTFYLSAGRLLVRGSVGTTENFVRIGHSLLAQIAVVVGGQLSRCLYGKRRESDREPARPQGSTSAVGTGDRVDG
jgi:hypothetical protein